MVFQAVLNTDMLPGPAPVSVLAKSFRSEGAHTFNPSRLKICWYLAQYSATSGCGSGWTFRNDSFRSATLDILAGSTFSGPGKRFFASSNVFTGLLTTLASPRIHL